LPVTVNFGVMVLNSISSNSGMFFGENVQYYWDSINKFNTGVFIPGSNDQAYNQYNIVFDSDLFDQLVNHINIDASPAPAILKGV
jgi:hypothetical protein